MADDPNIIELDVADDGYEALQRHRWCRGSNHASNRPPFGFVLNTYHDEPGPDPRRDYFNVDPDYQRPSRWTTEQREKFLGHWAAGGGVPAIVLHAIHETTVWYNVVDGKQRMEAIWAWVDGEVDAVLPPLPAKAEEPRRGRKLVNHRLEAGTVVRLRWADLSRLTKRHITNRTMPFIELPKETTRLQILRTYRDLNRAGTPHTEAEIAHVDALIDAELAKLE